MVSASATRTAKDLTPDDTFPFLKVARDFNVDYGMVVRFVEEWNMVEGIVGSLASRDPERGWTMWPWQRAAIAAYNIEIMRQENGPWL